MLIHFNIGVPNSALKALRSLAKHPELTSTLLAAASVTPSTPLSLYHPSPFSYDKPFYQYSTSHHRKRYTNTGGYDMLEGKKM